MEAYRILVTLFVYPSAISHASYAMTWPELREMRASALVEVQSHSYWHPYYKLERQRLSKFADDKLVRMQLVKSSTMLEQQLNETVDMLAWPFGIHDKELERQAKAVGYIAAFTLERRPATAFDDPLALPRYLVTNQDRDSAFGKLLGGDKGAFRARSMRSGNHILP